MHTKRSSFRRALNPSVEYGGKNRHIMRLAVVFIFAYLEDAHAEATMSQTTTMTVRISGTLSEFVASNVGENGSYENISEYVRDLIRRDKERAEREGFDRLKAELTRAFAAPEESYRPLTAAEVIARNRG
jgi:antitoxin ParD1/3/4